MTERAQRRTSRALCHTYERRGEGRRRRANETCALAGKDECGSVERVCSDLVECGEEREEDAEEARPEGAEEADESVNEGVGDLDAADRERLRWQGWARLRRSSCDGELENGSPSGRQRGRVRPWSRVR